jgi:hypothetical protein
MKNENKSNEKKDTPIILPMQEASDTFANSAFCLLPSAFLILHSPFSILNLIWSGFPLQVLARLRLVAGFPLLSLARRFAQRLALRASPRAAQTLREGDASIASLRARAGFSILNSQFSI